MGMRSTFMNDTGHFALYYLGNPQTAETRGDLARLARDTLPQIGFK